MMTVSMNHTIACTYRWPARTCRNNDLSRRVSRSINMIKVNVPICDHVRISHEQIRKKNTLE